MIENGDCVQVYHELSLSTPPYQATLDAQELKHSRMQECCTVDFGRETVASFSALEFS
jgi:hypothetical protein